VGDPAAAVVGAAEEVVVQEMEIYSSNSAEPVEMEEMEAMVGRVVPVDEEETVDPAEVVAGQLRSPRSVRFSSFPAACSSGVPMAQAAKMALQGTLASRERRVRAASLVNPGRTLRRLAKLALAVRAVVAETVVMGRLEPVVAAVVTAAPAPAAP
jgi:hypothetical protein